MEQSQEMTPIETKEIRGLSFKGLLTILLSTISICGTVVGTYFSLNAKIDTIRIEKVNEDKLTDLRIKTIEAQVEALKTSIETIRAQVDLNARQLRDGK